MHTHAHASYVAGAARLGIYNCVVCILILGRIATGEGVTNVHNATANQTHINIPKDPKMPRDHAVFMFNHGVDLETIRRWLIPLTTRKERNDILVALHSHLGLAA